MDNNRLQELISAITTNQKKLSEAENRRKRYFEHEIFCIKQAIAIEYAARNNWKLICSPIDRLNKDSVVMYEDLERKEYIIKNGSRFTIRMLSENKKANNYWRPDYSIDNHYIDHPYFYKDMDYRAAAIIAHSYNMPDIKPDAIRFAECKNLQVSFPDFPSWHFPGWTQIIQYTSIKQDGI